MKIRYSTAILVFFVTLSLFGCSFSSESNFSAEHQSQIQVAPFRSWQTFSYISGIHKWVESADDYELVQLVKPSKELGTAYLFISDSKLILKNRIPRGENWELFNGEFIPSKQFISKVKYSNEGWEFYFDYSNSEIVAVSIHGYSPEQRTSLSKGTFVYDYASHEGTTVAISNYGIAKAFVNGEWKDMYRHGYTYNFNSIFAEDEINKPTQFYSSLNFKGKTLLGEWPTGMLYEFDGESILPSDLAPPFTKEKASERLGYEAQSMAIYCGDLFVGYWPKGEIWVLDGITHKWSKFARLFSEQTDEDFIPYSSRPSDQFDPSFFGQRVTSLIPFEDSLYVSTANLREWSSYPEVSIMPRSQIDEYGMVYKIHKPGCETQYAR